MATPAADIAARSTEKRRSLLRLLSVASLGSMTHQTAWAQIAPSHWLTQSAEAERLAAFVEMAARELAQTPLQILQWLASTQRQELSLRLIQPPAPGRKSWSRYRDQNLDRQRIEGGVNFWRKHESALTRAQSQWGVPAAIIVAIIGVETFYGRVTGSIPTLDALTTLGFDYPRRGEFFRDELLSFLQLCREQGLDPTQVQGSFAGALGLPQFMPSSWRRWAVDFDQSGSIDLINSPQDAIGSVANFLAEHGWQRGQPTHVEAVLTANANTEALLAQGILPKLRVSELASYGVKAADALSDDPLAALIDLPDYAAPGQWWLGLNNFYVVTRYNRSNFYAASVISLAHAVDQARQSPIALTSSPKPNRHRSAASSGSGRKNPARQVAVTPVAHHKHHGRPSQP